MGNKRSNIRNLVLAHAARKALRLNSQTDASTTADEPSTSGTTGIVEKKETMNERKAPIFVETVKMEEEKFQDDSAEDEPPPNLAPAPPIPRFAAVPVFPRSRIPSTYPYRRVEPFEHTSEHGYSSVERYNEEVATRFLLGNGLPLTSIEDHDLRTFLTTLNPSRSLPEPSNMTTKAYGEYRPSLSYQKSIGPLNVTIEAIRKNDEIFLSISVHYYDSLGERHNTVHFEKIILADYEGKVVADRLRRVIDANKSMNFGISNILSPNLRMLTLVAENMPFKNRFICFFSYLSNIAREVIQIPEFLSSLKLLREYVGALRKHPEVYTKFRKMLIESKITTDIPALDVESDWLSTLQFLSTCGLLNETFSNLHENWCMPKYLDAVQENSMAFLLDFLLVLCNVATQICSEDSSVSQVLYSMSIVNNAIENCGIVEAREKMRSTFSKYYSSISNGKIGDFYSISALLDPRYGYSPMIFSEEDWENVEGKLLKEMSTTHQKNLIVRKELQRYRELLVNRPLFDESNTPGMWWNDLQEELQFMYKKWFEYSGLPAVSIDGKRFFAKGGKLAHLFATLDEELHFKAMLLAQSSQDFVGRGSASILIFNQITDGASTFRRLENEDSVKMEVDANVEETEILEDVKLELVEQPAPEIVLQEIKAEEPDDFTA
ncbi:Inappropriate Vulval cell Proliferation Homolog [Caenorhabditis elegans]|nr:Inappropriate Vulval cell Proliferation Homolog [Caenorhabditis elegans]CCD74092.1 Inappropriate Vulval cell Proliferation Homolog [Caenorhabditis elegans]|eukprot:NP_001023557.1 Uncharacterized protein CELE_Y67D8C.3 [Caenorhabditis elegans]